jgi:hypothetical protein
VFHKKGKQLLFDTPAWNEFVTKIAPGLRFQDLRAYGLDEHDRGRLLGEGSDGDPGPTTDRTFRRYASSGATEFRAWATGWRSIFKQLEKAALSGIDLGTAPGLIKPN